MLQVIFSMHFSVFAIPAKIASLQKALSIPTKRPEVTQNVGELSSEKQTSFL